MAACCGRNLLLKYLPVRITPKYKANVLLRMKVRDARWTGNGNARNMIGQKSVVYTRKSLHHRYFIGNKILKLQLVTYNIRILKE